MKIKKRINNLLIIQDSEDSMLYSVSTIDRRLLLIDATYEEAILFCTSHREYLSNTCKVRYKDIKAERIDSYHIQLTCKTIDNQTKQMISRYSTIEMAKKEFYSKINRNII